MRPHIENANPYGTLPPYSLSSSSSARYVMDHAHAGMIGAEHRARAEGVFIRRLATKFGGPATSPGKLSIEF
jgi:malonate-semialdehyde dehydrogenase (acetylating)/methylmalonate-semialdehyde dehydrogenase